MKNNLSTLSLLLSGIALVGCNSGSTGNSNNTTPVYLESGIYKMTLNNPQGELCSNIEPYSVISNGQGELCQFDDETSEKSECQETVNLTNSPCLSLSETFEEITFNNIWKKCSTTSTGMQAQVVASIVIGNLSSSCTAEMVLTKLVQ